MTPKISVIVPVFNTGHPLFTCLKSIQHQSFAHFECLLIDDGSTDERTISICEKFVKQDARFRLIKKENEGIEKTRIFGVANAIAELIAFSDHDDYYERNAFEILHNSWENSRADIICGNCYTQRSRLFPVRSKMTGISQNFLLNKIEFAARYYSNFFGINLFPVSTWGKLYNKNLFANSLASFGYNFIEDIVLNAQLFARANSVHFIPDFVYTHIYGGLSSSFNPEKVLNGYSDIFAFRQKLADQENVPNLIHSVLFEYKNVVKQYLYLMLENGYSLSSFMQVVTRISDSTIFRELLTSGIELDADFNLINDKKYKELYYRLVQNQRKQDTAFKKLKRFLKKVLK